MTNQPRMTNQQSVADAEASDEGYGRSGWGSYRWLWSATAVSAFGDGARLTALPLLAVSYTRDPALVALVTVVGLLPMLLSPLAGVAADRWNRRSVIITADTFRLALVAGLAVAVLAHVAGFWLILCVALLLGLGEVLFVVTSQTFLPEVVHSSRMTSAYGRQYAAQLVFRETLGQPAGGLLFAIGAAVPLLVDASSFAVGVLLLFAVRTVAGDAAAASAPKPRWAQMVKEGYRYLRDDRLLLRLAAMLGFLNFFIAGASALLVVYVLQWLRLEQEAFGFFLAAGAVGGALGGLVGSRLQKRFGLFQAALGGLLLTGIDFLLLGLVRNPWLAGAAFLVMTFGGVIYQTLTVSFRQTTVKRELLGRVNGAYRLIGTGPAPLGALVAGLIGKEFGVQVPFLLGGVAVLLLVGVATRPILRLAATAAPAGA